MRGKGSMKYNALIFIFTMLSILWSVNAYALERRVGSLEFTCVGGEEWCNPVGMVVLNHIDDKKPSIEYQIPQPIWGDFTTPWGVLIDGGNVIADTLIVLTNPNTGVSISYGVILRDKNGVIDGENCTKTITVGPKKTRLRSTRELFSGCPTVTP